MKVQSLKTRIILAVTIFLSAAVLLSVAQRPVAAASDFKGELCGGASLELNAGSCKGDNSENKLNDLIGSIINVFSLVIGVVAIVMLLIGGLKFITSSGDAGRLTSAKQTIIYALVGLIIVALAQAAVRFILNKI